MMMLRLLARVTLTADSFHSTTWPATAGMPAPEPKSPAKAAKATQRRIMCFLKSLQLSGSLGLSVGCGTKIVWRMSYARKSSDVVGNLLVHR
jgi:hypothetical protein